MLLDVDSCVGSLFSAFVRIVSDAGIAAILLLRFGLILSPTLDVRIAFSCKPRIGQLD